MSTTSMDAAALAQLADLGLARREAISTAQVEPRGSTSRPNHHHSLQPRKPTANSGAWAGYKAPADDQFLQCEDLDDGQSHRRVRIPPGHKTVVRKEVDLTTSCPNQAKVAEEIRKIKQRQELRREVDTIAAEASIPQQRRSASTTLLPLSPDSNHTAEPEIFRQSPHMVERRLPVPVSAPAQQQLQLQPQQQPRSSAADRKPERVADWVDSAAHLGKLDSSKWAED